MGSKAMGLRIPPTGDVGWVPIAPLQALYDAIDCRTVDVVPLTVKDHKFDMWIDDEYAYAAEPLVNWVAMDIATAGGRPDLGGIGPHKHWIGGTVVLANVNSEGDTITLHADVLKSLRTLLTEAGRWRDDVSRNPDSEMTVMPSIAEARARSTDPAESFIAAASVKRTQSELVREAIITSLRNSTETDEELYDSVMRRLWQIDVKTTPQRVRTIRKELVDEGLVTESLYKGRTKAGRPCRRWSIGA